MVEVASYPRQTDDAELAQMLLWAAGIPYEIANEAPVGHTFEPGNTHLYVDEHDVDDALFALTYRPAPRERVDTPRVRSATPTGIRREAGEPDIAVATAA